VLTESASVDIASPINIPFEKLDHGIGYDAKVATWNFPDPWKGGAWHLSDIVDYQLDAFFSIANNAAEYRERYLNNFYQIGVRAVNPKAGASAYIIPAEQTDSATTARLINILRTGEVDVERATSDFNADGKHYSSGSYVVQLAQPYGGFAKTLLEIQDYPNIPEYPGGPLQRPYDVTAQTLPLLFGVTAVPVKDKISVASSKVDFAKAAAGHFEKSSSGNGYLIADNTNSSLYALFALLAKDVRAYRLTGAGLDPGTIYVPQQEGTVAAWLQDHPGTEIVSRDRASAYAEATRRAASQAVQIADRWHLMRNMSEALRTALEPHHRVLKQAAQGSIQGFIASAPPPLPSSTLSAKQQNRQRRYSLYEEMKALAAGGTSQSDIARQLDLSLHTVQRWTRAGVFPERTPRSYPHSVDAYVRYLDQRLHQGCHNVSQLWRELRQQGYRGQLSSVWNWLHQHRGHTKRSFHPPNSVFALRLSIRPG